MFQTKPSFRVFIFCLFGSVLVFEYFPFRLLPNDARRCESAERISKRMGNLYNRSVKKCTLPELNLLEKSQMKFDSSSENLVIAVYGGSISYGAGASEAYSVRLQKSLASIGHNVTVKNHAIPASGPEHFILCGIDFADVIISEFRINGGDFQSWYRLASRSTKHLIILDLWSWLTPPTFKTSWTVQSAIATYKEDPERFSILSVEKMHLDNWRSTITNFFDYPYAQFDDTCDLNGPESCPNSIARECFDSKWEHSEQEKAVIQKCRRKYANSMQHGRHRFHDFISKQLVIHITDFVLPSLEDSPRKEQVSKRASLCFGRWGVGDRLGALGGVHSGVVPWSGSIKSNSSFSIGSPLTGREDKITLNSNVSGANLILGCPKRYTSARVGHVCHSDHSETASFMINNNTLTTALVDEKRPHTRIRQFTQNFNVPIEVVVTSLEPDAFIELTDFVCME